jgi:hypothetical protein
MSSLGRRWERGGALHVAKLAFNISAAMKPAVLNQQSRNSIEMAISTMRLDYALCIKEGYDFSYSVKVK